MNAIKTMLIALVLVTTAANYAPDEPSHVYITNPIDSLYEESVLEALNEYLATTQECVSEIVDTQDVTRVALAQHSIANCLGMVAIRFGGGWINQSQAEYFRTEYQNLSDQLSQLSS